MIPDTDKNTHKGVDIMTTDPFINGVMRDTLSGSVLRP